MHYIKVPHEVKYQRTVYYKRTSIMKNGPDVNIQMGNGTRCSR